MTIKLNHATDFTVRGSDHLINGIFFGCTVAIAIAPHAVVAIGGGEFGTDGGRDQVCGAGIAALCGESRAVLGEGASRRDNCGCNNNGPAEMH